MIFVELTFTTARIFMQIGRFSSCLRVLILTLIFGFMNAVPAQNINPEVLSANLGVMDFKFNAPSGWKIKDSPELNVRVNEMLLDEGIRFKQNFVFANEKTGALLFGYWNEFPRGSAFEASQVLDREPTFPDSWGIDPTQITSGLKTSSKGLEYAVVRAVGWGDGKTFVGRNKSIKTLAIWANVLIQYDSPSKAGSGMIMLQYRGPDFNDGKNSKLLADNQKMPGDILIRDLIDSLKLDPSVVAMSVDDYKAKYPKEAKPRSKDKAEVGPVVAGPQQGVSEIPKSGHLDMGAKFPAEAIEIINNAR
jgi:hypothetical protein